MSSETPTPAAWLAGTAGMTDRAVLRRMRTCVVDISDLLGQEPSS